MKTLRALCVIFLVVIYIMMNQGAEFYVGKYELQFGFPLMVGGWEKIIPEYPFNNRRIWMLKLGVVNISYIEMIDEQI